MPIQLIKSSEYKVMPWKNGLGTTSQIDVVSSATSTDFLWRVSSAKVSSTNPFSLFPGYDRLLAVWQGSGLLLKSNERVTRLLPEAVLRFSGDSQMDCELISDEVIDLGLIYRLNLVNAEMSCQKISSSQALNLRKATHYLFCAEGSFAINKLEVDSGDTLKIENDQEQLLKLEFTSAAEVKLFHLICSMK